MRTLTIVALLLGIARVASAQCDQSYLKYFHSDTANLPGSSCPPPSYTCRWTGPRINCRTGQSTVVATAACKSNGVHTAEPGVTTCTLSAAASNCSGSADKDDCDGIDADNNGLVDEGCQPTSSPCEEKSDGTPIFFASGLVRTNEVTDFRLPAADFPLELRRIWLRGNPYRPAFTGDGSAGTLSYLFQPTSIGHGWRMSWQDSLLLSSAVISPTVKPSWISWVASESIKFTPDAYVADPVPYWRYRSHDGRHELRFYGDVTSAPDARILRVADGRVWEFSLRPDVYPMGGEGIALLDRIARPAESLTFTGGTSVIIGRDSRGSITTLTDTEGRVLTVEYENGALVKQIKLGTEILVRFVYFPDGTPGPAGRPGREFLERVETGFNGTTPTTYIRYIYVDVPTVAGGTNLERILAKVVLRGTAASPAAVGEPAVQAGEIALENHEYLPGGRAKRGTSLAQDFAYEYTSNGITKQFDLRRPQLSGSAKVACTSSSNCASGYGCWVSSTGIGGDGFCYRQKTINYSTTTFATTSTSGVCPGCGGTRAYTDATFGYRTKRWTDPKGTRRSFTWDSKGRPLCIVTNDDNDDAGSPPTCNAPATAAVNWFSYAGSLSTCNASETSKVKSVIAGASPNERASTTTRDCGGRVATSTVTGWTRDLTGAAVQQTRTTAYTYDTMGRMTKVDGPLSNAVAYDVVDLAYYGATGDANAHRLQTVTRYVGTRASCPGVGCTTLVTTYASYDKFGTPRSVADPSGIEVTRVTDAIGRVTEERVEGATDEVTTATYNPDGTILKVVDADGVCHTFDYNEFGLVKARRRSGPSLCGAAPIVTTTGEVEVYAYDATHPANVSVVERYQDGVLAFRKQYTYDEKGLLSGLPSAIDDTKSRKFTYDAADLLTLDERENCYPGSTTCTKDTTAWDALWRKSSWSRAVTDTASAVAGFQFVGPQGAVPSTVTTGNGTTVATTTTYVYDDFGELVEYGSPDGGTTRLVYDVGGRLTTRREGAGSADQRTVAMTFDSLGRTLTVDHDTEHPVDCATAPTGTPITDVEYAYDVCPAPAPTGFSCGSHTAGRLTRARVKLHCSAGQPFTRGTWYAYGDTGRVSTIAVADDDTMATPFLTTHTWTLAGRAKTVGNPLSATYGMDFAYDEAGRLAEIRQTDVAHTPYIGSITYAPFGPPTSYTTQSMSGGQPLVRELSYFLDYSVQQSKARRGATTTGGFAYTRDATGRITSRDSLWTGTGAPIDRYYLYDRVGRLLCETTTAQTTCPTSGSDLRSTFTYQNGQSQQAPDNRASATFSTFGGTQGAHTYAANTNRLTNVGGYLDFFHDALGRRTKDDDTSYPGLVGGRQYTYLPNGRLGTISGKTVEVVAGGYLLDVDYTVVLAYDHEGRVFQIARTSLGETETWDLHHDALGRIIATRWTPKPSTGLASIDNHYVSFGNLRIARVEIGSSTTRYWSVDDALGTTFEEVSETGASTLRDREAFGTMTAETFGALSFAFPGQFEIPGTKVLRADQCVAGCGVPGVPCPTSCPLYFMRSGLVQNHHREYDPDTGKYLELDSADERSAGRLALNWNYAMGDPLLNADAEGRDPVTLTIGGIVALGGGAFLVAGGVVILAYCSGFACPSLSEIADTITGQVPLPPLLFPPVRIPSPPLPPQESPDPPQIHIKVPKPGPVLPFSPDCCMLPRDKGPPYRCTLDEVLHGVQGQVCIYFCSGAGEKEAIRRRVPLTHIPYGSCPQEIEWPFPRRDGIR